MNPNRVCTYMNPNRVSLFDRNPLFPLRTFFRHLCRRVLGALPIVEYLLCKNYSTYEYDNLDSQNREERTTYKNITRQFETPQVPQKRSRKLKIAAPTELETFS